MANEANRIQGMVRSIDQWRNMVPSAVTNGSKAQVEYALTDAKTDIEALWSKVATLSSEQARDAFTELDQLRDRVKELEKALSLFEGYNCPVCNEATPPAPKVTEVVSGEPIKNDKGTIVAYRDYAGNVGWVGSPSKKTPAPPAVVREGGKIDGRS